MKYSTRQTYFDHVQEKAEVEMERITLQNILDTYYQRLNGEDKHGR